MNRTTLFRCEPYSGSGVRDAVSVMAHEMGELRNTDILDYCLAHYDLKKMHFDSTLQVLRDSLNDGDEVEPGDIRILSEDLLKHIERNTGHCVRYALWLAGKDSVIRNYNGTEETIDAYETGPVILSDLGEDGVLYGYTNEPKRTSL